MYNNDQPDDLAVVGGHIIVTIAAVFVVGVAAASLGVRKNTPLYQLLGAVLALYLHNEADKPVAKSLAAFGI